MGTGVDIAWNKLQHPLEKMLETQADDSILPNIPVNNWLFGVPGGSSNMSFLLLMSISPS